MKKIILVLLFLCAFLCSCGKAANEEGIIIEKGGKYSYTKNEEISINSGSVTIFDSTLSTVGISNVLTEKDSIYLDNSNIAKLMLKAPCTVWVQNGTTVESVSTSATNGTKIVTDKNATVSELIINSNIKEFSFSGVYKKVIVESSKALIVISDAKISELIINGEQNSIEIKGDSVVKKLEINELNNGYKTYEKSQIEEIVDNTKIESETEELNTAPKGDTLTNRQKVCRDAKALAEDGDHSLSKKTMREYFLAKGYSSKDTDGGMADAEIDWKDQALQYVINYLSSGNHITPYEMQTKLELFGFAPNEIMSAKNSSKADKLWKEQAVYYAAGIESGDIVTGLKNLDFTNEQAQYGKTVFEKNNKS